MMAILLPILLIVIGISTFALYQKYTNGVCKSKKRLVGKTAIVTGGTAGMGLEIATDFAKRGARVIIASPFLEKGTRAQQTIVRNTGNDKVVFKLLDLGSLDSVRKFAADILKTEDRLDILVNNAAVGVPKDFITPDSMSFIMQVNYVGHFLLTLLLLPLLTNTRNKSSEASRVVNTSSLSHMLAKFGEIKLNKLNFINFQSYYKSKFCLVLFTLELCKKLDTDTVVVNCIDPGLVGTRIYYDFGKVIGPFLSLVCWLVYKTPRQGAQTALHVALDQEAGEVSGQFFKNCQLSRAIPEAYNDKLTKEIWQDSIRLVKLDEADLKKCFKSM